MLPTLNFGTLIAFMLPGFIAAYGLGYVYTSIQRAFLTLTSSEPAAARVKHCIVPCYPES